MTPSRRANRHFARTPASSPRPSVNLYLALALLVALAVGGGSSKADVWALLALRPLLLVIGLVLLVRNEAPARYRGAWMLLAAFAALTVVQLVPLPPSLWLQLPGHARFAPSATLVGMEQPWRPVSLVPLLTWNSLLALLAPAAALAAMGALGSVDRHRLLWAVIAVAGLSAVLGTIQIASNGAPTFYLFAGAAQGLPVGLFANRNHQAVLLAATLPLLAVWARDGGVRHRLGAVAPLTALGVAVFLLMMILVTGSRAGSMLGALCAVAALALGPKPARLGARGRALLVAAGLLLPVAAAVLTILSNRAVALQRLMASDGLPDDQRFREFPTVARMVREFFPLGTGFGTFDPAFRIFETDASLQATYFNHAHNDLVEIVLQGGVGAALLVTAFLAWYLRTGLALARQTRGGGEAPVGWACAVAATALLAASLFDYPLRTPLLGFVLAVFLCGLTDAARPAPGTRALVREGRSR